MTKDEIIMTIESFEMLNNIFFVEIADELKIEQSTLNAILSGEQEFTDDVAEIISNEFGFNKEFLTKGILPIFDENKKNEKYNYDIDKEQEYSDMQDNSKIDIINKLVDTIKDLTEFNNTLIKQYNKCIDILLNKLNLN